jgi:hypothetical protein
VTLRGIFEAYDKIRADAARLTPFHRRLTNAVGALGCLLGLAALIPYIYLSREAFGIPLAGGSLEGIRLRFILWGGSLLIAIAVLFYLGCVLVAGSLAGSMLALGKMTFREAVAYMFLSKYPAHWNRK